MAKRKPASGGQSQGPPKQAAGGGASRSSNPQAANRPANTSHPHKTGNGPAKNPTSSGTGAPPKPAQNTHRPPNGTNRSQGPGNGAPKSQGANGQPSNSAARVEAMSGPRAMNEGSSAPKRNGNGQNNHPQKAQGHGTQPNGSSKQQAPKPPKHSQPFLGGHSPAPNQSLHSPAPPRPHPVHVHVPKAQVTSVAGNKVFQDPSPTQKQNGHAHQKTQNHVQTPGPPKASQTNQSGKNTVTGNNFFSKVQVAETHAAQQTYRGGQSSASAKGPQAGNSSESHNTKQHHKAPPHSLFMQETSKQDHKKPTTNDSRQGQPPTANILPNFLSFFSGSEVPQNPPHKSQQHKGPTHSRPVQEVPSHKGHKDNSPKPQMNDRRQGQLPTETLLSTPSPLILSTGSKGPGNPSPSHKSQHKEPTYSHLVQEVYNKGHKDTSKPSTNDRRQGQPPSDNLLPKLFSIFSSGSSEGPQNPPHKSQKHKAETNSRPAQEISNQGHNLKDTPPKPPMNDKRQGQIPTKSVLSTPKESPPILSAESKGPGNPSLSHKSQHKAPTHSHPLEEVLSNKGHKDRPPKPPANDRHHVQPPTQSVLPNFFSIFSSSSEGSQNTLPKSQQHKAPTHSHPSAVQEVSNKGHNLKGTPPKPPMNDRRQGQMPTESLLSTAKESPPILAAGVYSAAKGAGSPPQKSQHKAAPTGSHSESRPMQEIISNKGYKDSPPKSPINNRRQGQPPTTESVQRPKVSFAPESKDTGNRSSNFVVPPQAESATHNSLSSTAGSGPLHSRTRTAKKQGPNVNQGTASVPQAPAGSQGWGQMFSSWIFPSAPSIDKGPQATSQQTSRKDAGPKPQSPKSSKDNDGSSKSHPAPTFSFISPEPLKKQPIPPKKGTNNRLHDLQDRSSELNTIFSETLPKKERAPAHDNKLTRSDGGPGGSSTVSKKPEMATDLSLALSDTMDRSQIPTRKKPKKSTVTHSMKVPVQSGLSRAQKLSQQLKKTQMAALRKDLLRQRGPTLIWREGDTPGAVSAYSTLTAAPVPSPPKNELRNKDARRTISQNPDLFKVVSPIKADVLKENLKDHPNQPFVKSVIRGLKNGFWPWADTSDLPTTYDGSGQRSSTKLKKDRANFIQQQSKDEMDLERWSKPFGDKLLPGMHASPIGAVPKSTPGKFRLVVDQSRGPHSLNSTIAKSQVKVKLDTVHDLGDKLLAVRKKHPKRKLCLWKSDVKSAYRQLPVHPLWQIKQAVPVDGQYHIDRCNTFGNRGGGWNWDRFISLVNWVGTEKKGVSDLLGYVDDNFGWEFEGRKEYYEPYKKKMPTKQVKLLRLWDEIGIPHDEEKQLSGPSLRILGYDVDANKMTVKVPDEKKEKVVQLLRSHAQEGKPYTVNELQSAAGSVNHTLSLYPRIRPGLRVLFDEMAKQKPGTTKLSVTKDVARTLSGLADFLEDAPPVPIREQKKSAKL